MKERQDVNITISTLTILKVVLVFLALGFVYLIRDVVSLVVVSFILASAFTPTVDWLYRKHKIPRVFGIVIIYVALFGVISLLLILLIPAIVQQIGDIANNFPQYYSRISSELGNLQDFKLTHNFITNLETSLQNFRTDLGSATGGILSTLSSVFGGLISLIGIMVITFYLIIEEQAMRRFLQNLVPPKYLPRLAGVLDEIKQKMGMWLRGQLLLSLLIFIVTFIGLSILGVRNALVLALFAGVMEFIPFIGSTIGAIPAVFFGFAEATWLGFVVIGMYILVQQLENNILVPKIMQKSVGLNPLVVIIVMLVGAKAAGIVGVLMAVPVVLMFQIIFHAIYSENKVKDSEKDFPHIEVKL
ncbi:MAG: AI-2E family transporter [Patescibacteria group bacterium]|jgi:predicted PurR-regulated permease PerM